MGLPEAHYSPNRWIAQVSKDTVLCDPRFHDKGKYVVICWSPLGLKCDKCKIFDTPEEAQEWLQSLEKYTQTVTTEYGKAKVFVIGDNEYWWSREEEGEIKFSKLYQVIDMSHAIAMVKSSLESLANKESVF